MLGVLEDLSAKSVGIKKRLHDVYSIRKEKK
jgi:hypothetical protein